MSQISSLPQPTQSVSRVLTADTMLAHRSWGQRDWLHLAAPRANRVGGRMMKPTPLIPVHSAHGCTGHLLRTAKGFRAFEVGAGRFSRVRTMRGLRSMACSIAATVY